MRRFSSMVSRGEDAPALGHLDDPDRDDVVGGHGGQVAAVEDDLSAARPQQSAHRVQHRRLARAVGADERDDLAVIDGQRDATQGLDVAVVGVQVGDLEQRHVRPCPAPARGAAALTRAGALAQVGLDDPLVALDLRRRALGDALAVVEDRDALGDAHDHAHGMLDEQDGDAALVTEAADEGRRLGRLGGVHAGRRLIEQQDARSRGQGPGDLEPTLVAIGQAGGLDVAPAGEAHVRQELLRLGHGGPLLLALTGRAQDRPDPA